MIWYNNIEAINAIRQGIREDFRKTHRGLRLVAAGDRSLRQ